jgi:hypothetical protein
MPNPRMRKTVAKALIKKKGSTAIAKKVIKKQRFTNPDQIADPKLRAVFDKTKSWMSNLDSVDLKAMYFDSLPEQIPSKAAWTISKLSEDEVVVVQKFMKSHGDSNFKKMAFDRKLNIYQWTAEQCEKKVGMFVAGDRVHKCEDGRCLCGYTPNSSYIAKEDRIRR